MYCTYPWQNHLNEKNYLAQTRVVKKTQIDFENSNRLYSRSFFEFKGNQAICHLVKLINSAAKNATTHFCSSISIFN